MNAPTSPAVTIDPEVLEYLRDPQTEEQVVRLIRQHLLQPAQRARLFELDLSVEDVLNGRFPMSLMPEIETIFADWNTRCGETLFMF